MASPNEEADIKELTDKFPGKWKEISCENVEDFFKEMGLNYLLRKIAMQFRPEIEILVEGADIQISFKTPFREECMKYKLNKEVEIENQKGKFNATTTYENGKLISKQTPLPENDAKPMVTEREINETGELVTTMYVGNVICKRVFTKLQ